MPFSSKDISALHSLAKASSSSEPAEIRLRGVLEAARNALGTRALSVVAHYSASDTVTAWHAFSPDSSIAAADLDSSAIAAFSAGKTSTTTIFSIPVTDGFEAAFVSHDNIDFDAHSAVVAAACGYAALLIENIKLTESSETAREEIKKHADEIAAIYELGQAIEPQDLTPILNTIVAKAASVMRAQTCSLMLLDENDGALSISASYGLADDIVDGVKAHFGEGIAGVVAESGEPMLIGDVADDPRFGGKILPKPGVSSSMCVPLKDQDQNVIGVLSIRRDDPNPPFIRDDLKLFGVFATHAALAISNARLYSAVHRKVEEMARISDLLHAINSTLDLDDVLDQIVESIVGIVGFDRCCVYLLDSRSNDFIAWAKKGYASSDKIRTRIGFDDEIIGLVAKEKIPIFSQGSPVEAGSKVRSGDFIAAPIVVRDSCIGIVIVDNCVHNRQIDPRNVELLATFVSQAGIAVENARLYQAMEEKYAEMNVLYEHSRGISAAYGLDNAAETLVKAACKIIRSDGAALLLPDAKRDYLGLSSCCGNVEKLRVGVSKLSSNAECIYYLSRLHNSIIISRGDTPADMPAATANVLAPDGTIALLAPLISEDAVIGVLYLQRGKYDEFQGSELKLISIITSHAATVLKNAISYEQKMQKRVLEMTALYEFSKRISAAANLGEALDSILAIVSDLVNSDESFIYAIEPEYGFAEVKASRYKGSHGRTPPQEPLSGDSVISWAINERKALLSPDISSDDRFTTPHGADKRSRSMMSIPLIVQDEVVGVLSVHSFSPNQYSEDDVRVLSIIASQGAAIYKELEALSAITSYTDNILSSIAAGVVTLDSEGYVLTWNTSAERIIGVRAGRIVGLQAKEALTRLAISNEDKEVLSNTINGVYDTGGTYQGYKLCFHPRRRDEVYINMSISQLLNSAGERLGLVIIFEDISREIKMENEFRRMGELAAVGQLAASIAHELRNPLSSIKGAAQFLQKEYEDHGSIVEFLGIIIEEVNGLNKLTTEFLDFARPMELELKPTSVNTVVEKTLQLMSVHITDNNVVVKQSLGTAVPKIQADEKQLEQVLKNMIINSLQAMPEGGVLTVETGATPSGGAYMVVGDTGMGIPVEKIDRIFQPFFTTKTKGTGLGLSVVSKIVENHGGRIDVASEMSKGTRFTITLPRTGAHPLFAAEIDQTMERRSSGELKGFDSIS